MPVRTKSLSAVVLGASLLASNVALGAKPHPNPLLVAKDLERQGRFADAAEQVRAALELRPSLEGRLRLASLEARASHLMAATEAAETVVENATKPGTKRTKQKAQALLATLKDRLPELRVTLKGKHPDDVFVQVDDVVAPDLAQGKSRPIDPGTHVVSVDAVGYGKTTRSVTVQEGEHKDVELRLPIPYREDPPEPTPEPPKPPPAAPPNVPAWISLGTGAALIAAGGILKASAGDQVTDGQKNAATAGNVALGVGIVAVGTAIVLWIVNPGGDKTATRDPLRIAF